jgi:hypothetical protein
VAVLVMANVLGTCWIPSQGRADGTLFPFVLPWDDASSGVTSLSGWLDKPAGKYGHVSVGKDGHLYAGTKRIKFSGVDLAFSANFPAKADAEKIAPRMAKFGINIVRFHIMDMRNYPDGIFARDGKNTRDLDPEALDRLDYFIDQLKRQGIYVYLCLLNYRPFNAADGLPKEIESMGDPFQGRHIVGFYDTTMLNLQKEYARKLLTHRNAYTGLKYTEDPAVVFTEINNENGLIHMWLGGTVDKLPEVFLPELGKQWNGWLKKRYGRTDKLRQVWNARKEPLGAEMLANTGFAVSTTRWDLERHPGAEATAGTSDDVPKALGGAKSALITVSKPGAESWHIRFEQGGFKVAADRHYELSFWAKADKACEIGASVEQYHSPWKNLGLGARIKLTPEWQYFRFSILANPGDDNARVVFDPAMQAGEYRFAGVSLRPGGVFGIAKEEVLEKGTISLFSRAKFGERTPEAQRDWMRFLWDTEDRYWQAMQDYIKGDLGFKGLVIGTVVGCSTPNLMAKLDCVDTHAYWTHPTFPGRPWDWENWFVQNISMVNDPGGTIPGLALKRVLGKPHCVTEYGIAAPNTHASEGNLLRDAYAALQDWDYVSTSRYSHQSNWDLRRIRNFFDMDQHPTRLVALVPAAAMFQRGDVRAAEQVVVAVLGKEREVDLLRQSHEWELVDGSHLGIPRQATLVHRTALAVEGETVPAGALLPEQVKLEGNRFVSDTGELDWNLTEKERGVVTVNTAKSKAVIGFGGGKRFDLGGVVIEPGPTLQKGWSAVTLTVMKGDSFTSHGNLLITATGHVENTNMGWKNPEKSSVGGDWGEAPTLVEGIPARITLPVSAKAAKAWALDERGQRKTPLAVSADAKGNAVVAIGPQSKTLWYEVEIR